MTAHDRDRTANARARERTDRIVRLGALAIGIALFCGALYYVDFRIAFGTIRQLGLALPLALFFSGLWHLVRTWAWWCCFPAPRTIGFARLARVRLAAEAFSYLTLRGIAGEPLKVVLLGDTVDARQATAAVALERLAYLIGTTLIVGIGSVMAIAGLPLTHAWFRVFRAFAIVSAVLAILTAVVIAGRGAYLHSWLAGADRLFGTSMSAGRIARFASAVERQMLDLVRGNPRRLIALLAATIAAYACMALEAWVILVASGEPVSLNGALAVETFSRVASFASAFIPANIGALEASSIAAVAAIGAAGAGAALALARRLRGLFWAGIGLAIYPRRARTTPSSSGGGERPSPPAEPPTLLYFPHDAAVTVPPSARLAGLPIVERVLRSARRAGHTRILTWDPQRPGADAEWRRTLTEMPPSTPVTAIGAGTIVSPALLARASTLAAEGGSMRDVPAGAGWPESGVIRLTAADAVDPAAISRALSERRDRALPLPSGVDVSEGRAMLALRIASAEDLASAEQTIRRAAYKDTDGTMARFNRRISLPISIALLRTPLTANQLSTILVALGFYAAWLFGTGQYVAGVLGGFLSLAASVLDGCDGEIARLKYQESALGCWIETFGDYSYYVAIFVGLTVGAVRSTGWPGFYWVGGVALAGTLLSFALLIYLRTRITGGQPEKLHAIARDRYAAAEPTFWSNLIWRISFVATRAAMPYGIFVFAVAGSLPVIVVLAAIGANVYWISILQKLRHLLGDEEAVAV